MYFGMSPSSRDLLLSYLMGSRKFLCAAMDLKATVAPCGELRVERLGLCPGSLEGEEGGMDRWMDACVCGCMGTLQWPLPSLERNIKRSHSTANQRALDILAWVSGKQKLGVCV